MTRWALLALPFVAGCGVPFVEEDAVDVTRNECSSDAECGGGSCQAGMCRATAGTFSSVLFEVTPPTTAPKIAGVQYLKRLDGLSLGGGEQDIALARLAHLKGSIVPNVTGTRSQCTDLGPAEFNVFITPSDRVLGIGAQEYAAEATATGTSFDFSLNLPAADYDIYVQPKTQPENPSCQLAPQLYRRRTIPEGGNVGLPLPLPVPSTLEIRVNWPVGDLSLHEWRADIIDPETRRVLSNEALLGTYDGYTYGATLVYSPVVGGNGAEGRELVRLRPSEEVAAPTILLERSGLEVTTPGVAMVDHLTALPSTVEVEGQVVVAGSPEHLSAANITVSAIEINSEAGIKPGVFTEYSQTASSDASGNFRVRLFPGRYRVVAVPPGGSGYATGIGEWEIGGSDSLQLGRTVEVAPLVSLNGNVVTVAGDMPVSGVTVNAVAAPAPLVVDPLDDRGAPIVPRAGSAIVDANGVFEFGTDPGAYDLSVRPAEGTGFAWFVRPNVKVDGRKTSISLGTLRMPLPLAYSGVVTADVDGAKQAIPGALIRAYVYVTSAQAYTALPAQAASVLQIAETRASDTGRFELFVPAALDAPPP